MTISPIEAVAVRERQALARIRELEAFILAHGLQVPPPAAGRPE